MIKADELKQKLYEYLKDKDVLSLCFDDIRNDTKPSEENIERRQFIAKEILKAGKISGGRQLTETEIEDYKKLKNKRIAKKVLTEVQEDINQVESSLIKNLDSQEYKAYLDHVIYNRPLTEQEKDYINSEIDSNFLVLMYAIFRHAFRYCFYENSGIADEKFKRFINAITYVGALEGVYDKSLEVNPILKQVTKTGESEEDFINAVDVYKEISDRINALADEEEKEPLEKESNNIVPFKMPYLDFLTVAETEMLSVITTKKFILDYNATKYSEEVINSLEDQDQEILDYITLTLYRNGYYYFTDRHIAVAMYKKTPTATVSDKMLEEVNASLKRIQDINLPIGYISEEINRKGKRAKLERDSKLIWLDVVKYDYDTKSTVYRIVDRPPYYDYALQTGRISTYNREIITRDIKGIQHDTKNTTLKQRFIRNIQALKQFSDVTMPITEVYNILAITDAHKYPNARKKSKEILDDLKNDFRFSYEFRRKNNKVTGVQFKKYTDRELEIKKN